MVVLSETWSCSYTHEDKQRVLVRKRVRSGFIDPTYDSSVDRILTENDRIKGIPVIGKLLGDNIDKNKHNIVLILAALVGYFI